MTTYLIRLRCNNCNTITASAIWTTSHSKEWNRSMSPVTCCSDRPNHCVTMEIIPRSERKQDDPPSVWNGNILEEARQVIDQHARLTNK